MSSPASSKSGSEASSDTTTATQNYVPVVFEAPAGSPSQVMRVYPAGHPYAGLFRPLIPFDTGIDSPYSQGDDRLDPTNHFVRQPGMVNAMYGHHKALPPMGHAIFELSEEQLPITNRAWVPNPDGWEVFDLFMVQGYSFKDIAFLNRYKAADGNIYGVRKNNLYNSSMRIIGYNQLEELFCTLRQLPRPPRTGTWTNSHRVSAKVSLPSVAQLQGRQVCGVNNGAPIWIPGVVPANLTPVGGAGQSSNLPPSRTQHPTPQTNTTISNTRSRSLDRRRVPRPATMQPSGTKIVGTEPLASQAGPSRVTTRQIKVETELKSTTTPKQKNPKVQLGAGSTPGRSTTSKSSKGKQTSKKSIGGLEDPNSATYKATMAMLYPEHNVKYGPYTARTTAALARAEEECRMKGRPNGFLISFIKDREQHKDFDEDSDSGEETCFPDDPDFDQLQGAASFSASPTWFGIP